MWCVNIEANRFENTPREERICPVCNMNTIENQYIFVLILHVTETLELNI